MAIHAIFVGGGFFKRKTRATEKYFNYAPLLCVWFPTLRKIQRGRLATKQLESHYIQIVCEDVKT